MSDPRIDVMEALYNERHKTIVDRLSRSEKDIGYVVKDFQDKADLLHKEIIDSRHYSGNKTDALCKRLEESFEKKIKETRKDVYFTMTSIAGAIGLLIVILEYIGR